MIAIQSKYLFLSLIVIAISLIGDHLLTIKRTPFNSYLIAFSDTLIHGFIAFFSWLLVYVSKGQPICEYVIIMGSIICGLTASAIDVDHVIAARSFDLRDISQLTGRPFLHNTSLTLVISVVIIYLGLNRHNWMCHTYGWIFLTASLTHHLRDAIRHGFWFFPFNTRPVPLWAYIISLVSYPLICSILMDIVSQEWLKRHTNDVINRYKLIEEV